MKRKLLSVLLSTLLLLGTLPLSASAANTPVSYWTWDSATQTLVEKTGNDACKTYTTVGSGTTTWDGGTTGGWYVVQGDITISTRITVTGNVHLILMDGCKLTAEGTDSSGGINVQDNDANIENGSPNSLTIYAQSTGESMGVLSATGGWNQASIGGGIEQSGGTITINGGSVNANSNSEAGIGGGNGGAGGTITINGGNVNATGGTSGAGIGGGNRGAGGAITINGGHVTAAGGNHGAGIGGGGRQSGGTITINGGNVTAIGGQGAAGIGSGWNGDTLPVPDVSAGTITINGGYVKATGGMNSGAGIGGGDRGAGGVIIINGGIVDTTGLEGAGIGSGNGGAVGTITINGGSVMAQSESGASIGCGANSDGGTITINGGSVTASSTAYGPGIGGGSTSAGVDITITGGIVYAIGGTSSAGIGGTWNSDGGTITITGGTVNATGGPGVVGIGPGPESEGGSFSTGPSETPGNALIIASSISDQSNKKFWSGVIFEGNDGKVYGSPTLATDGELTANKRLEIESEKELIVSKDVTLTNNDELVINGTLTNNGELVINGTLTINGTFTNNGSITGTGKITPEDKKLTAAITNIVVTPETYNDSPANVDCDYTGDGKETVTWYADKGGVAGSSLGGAPTNAGVYHVGISAEMGNFYKAMEEVTQRFTIAPATTDAPNIAIDYEAETLTGFEKNGNYTVNNSPVELTADNTLAINETWLNDTVSIVRKAADSNHKDSETQELAIPARPDAPTGTAACSIDTGTEQITISEGYEVNTASDFGSGTAVDNGAKIAPGATLYARKAATATDFKSKAQTITAPSRGTAPAVEINYTNETLNTTTAMQYQIVTSGQTVPSWQDCAATMAATAFDWDGTAAVAVQFRTKATGNDYASNPQETLTIPVRPAAPNLPVEKSKTHNSVTLETIAPNANSAAAQYSKDGGITWQDSPEFTGLTASTKYSFAARYAATENSVASPASALVEITTSPAPSGGGGSYTPPSYKPEVEQPSEGGEVTVTPARPERGDQVTVTTKPEKGYQVDKIIVTDKDGDPVEVKDNGDGTFSFTQPTGKVKIEVTYKLAETEWANPFTDVPEGAWYYESVAYVVENDLFFGTSETKFSPNAPMTRAMLMTVLARADGQDTTAPEGGKWYDTGMKWAVEQGISDGTDPEGDITREQLATMLYRYAGSPAAPNLVLDFTDAGEVSDYAQNALRWAVEQGIITGKGGGILDPKGNATRAEVAAMLMRFLSRTAN